MQPLPTFFVSLVFIVPTDSRMAREVISQAMTAAVLVP
jgi:hypothetical protein